MPHYFFEVVNGHRTIDPVGVDCPSDEHAKAQAIKIARQIAEEVPSSIKRRHVAIKDGQGRDLGSVEVDLFGSESAQETDHHRN
jgi:uncharacterized protein DUF6894